MTDDERNKKLVGIVRTAMTDPVPVPEPEPAPEEVLFNQLLAGDETLLTPGQVAAWFRVDPKTVTKWSAAGKLECVRTPGGHRRYRESVVRRLLAAQEEHPQADAS